MLTGKPPYHVLFDGDRVDVAPVDPALHTLSIPYEKLVIPFLRVRFAVDRASLIVAPHRIDEVLFPGTRVLLYYSAERKVIGIKPINNQSEYSPITISGESEFPLIYCRPFLDHYKISYPYYYSPSYDAIWNHEAGMLMIRVI